MAIKNAKILDAIISFNDQNDLSARITFHTYVFGILTTSFNFANSVDVQRLKKLMNYAEVSQFNDLIGKIVRVGFVPGRCFIGFGHPFEDRFVPMNIDCFSEVTECKFEEFIKVTLTD